MTPGLFRLLFKLALEKIGSRRSSANTRRILLNFVTLNITFLRPIILHRDKKRGDEIHSRPPVSVFKLNYLELSEDSDFSLFESDFFVLLVFFELLLLEDSFTETAVALSPSLV